MNGNLVLKTVEALSKPACKLIDAVSSSIGQAYRPRYIKRMSDAKAYEIKTISQALKDNSDLPISYNSEGVSVDSSNFEELLKRTGKRLAFQELKKQENLENIVDSAFIELQSSDKDVDADVDPDWMSRFINSASRISDYEIQGIWSKILTGEILRPNSYSLRVLKVLEDISQSEALTFSKMSKFIFSHLGMYNDDEILAKHAIEYSDLFALEECGLINVSGFIMYTKPLEAGKREILFRTKNYVLIGLSSDKNIEFAIPQYPLTEAGKGLIKIVRPDNEVDYDFLIDSTKKIKATAKNSTISLHKIVALDNDGTIRYDKESLI